METNEKIKEAAQILSKAQKIVAFTGAGMSAESGIPPFRGEGGIWGKYDPDSLDIDYYFKNTQQSWNIIREVFYNFFNNNEIKPNRGHEVIAKWEKEGRLTCVITQNIDDLHRIAGNRTIYEFHGNMTRFVCTKCNHKFEANEVRINEKPPRCEKCGGLLKPDFVFFGEGIPEYAMNGSFNAAMDCDAFVIIGTSGQVMPANMIPGYAKRNGAKIIEINLEPSTYTNTISDIFIQGKSAEILSSIDALIER